MKCVWRRHISSGSLFARARNGTPHQNRLEDARGLVLPTLPEERTCWTNETETRFEKEPNRAQYLEEKILNSLF